MSDEIPSPSKALLNLIGSIERLVDAKVQKVEVEEAREQLRRDFATVLALSHR